MWAKLNVLNKYYEVHKLYKSLRFKVFMAVKMLTVVWVVMQCSLVAAYSEEYITSIFSVEAVLPVLKIFMCTHRQ
jgi:hypothetical protein